MAQPLPNDMCMYCDGTAGAHAEECKAAPLHVDENAVKHQREVSARMVLTNLRAELGIAVMVKIELAVLVASGSANNDQLVEFDQYVRAGDYTLEKLGLVRHVHNK